MALEDTKPQIGLFDKSPGEGVTSTSSTGVAKSKEERRRKRESKGLLRKTKTKQRIRGQLPVDETPPIDISLNSQLLSVPPSQQFNLQSLNLTSSIPSLGLHGPEIDAVTGPVKPPKDGWGVKTLDFLFGTEAAVIGIAHDTEGWAWSVENMKQQWSEQPLWVNLLGTASIAGTMLFPATRALSMSARFGKLATKTGRYGGEAAEIAKWKEMGKVDSHVRTFADLGQGHKTAELLRKMQLKKSWLLPRSRIAPPVSPAELPSNRQSAKTASAEI